MAWQWANLGSTLDPWLDSQPDKVVRLRVLDHMAGMVERPDGIIDVGTAYPFPLVRQLVVPDTNVLLVYLRAEQFRTLRLIVITEIRESPRQ